MPHDLAQAGVIGDPIQHSRSPQLHQAAYKVMGWNASYSKYRVPAGTGPEFFQDYKQQEGATGLSVTMPQKAEMLSVVDSVSERARMLGALNTIYKVGDTWHGHNTDVDGILKALTNNAEMNPGAWLIIGAGNTATAVIAAANAASAGKVSFAVRNRDRAQDSVNLAHKFGLDVELFHLDQITPKMVGQHAAVVSTLPPTAADSLLSNWPTELDDGVSLPPLLDVAYEPWPSVLASTWTSYGATSISGLEMLLYQAIEQIKLFAPKQWAAADHQAVLDAMCDAVELPQRKV